jgi:hypothetical protein
MGKKIPLAMFKKHLRRLGTPADVMKRLGLDEFVGVQDEHDDPLHKYADRVVDQLLKRFGTPQRVLTKLGMDQAMLTEPEHMRSDPRGGTGGKIEGKDDFEVPGSGSSVPRKIETEPAQNLSAEDDEEDEYGPFADYLRNRGVAEDVIRGAVDYHRRRRGMDNRRPNGHASRDALPRNHIRRPGEPPSGYDRGEGPPGLLDGLDRQAFDSKAPRARIVVEPGVASSDRSKPTAKDRKLGPSKGRISKTNARYPGMNRIET